MLEKALSLARLGLHVFPVRLTESNQKIPLTENGLSDATTDETAITHWFTEKYPNAKVGVHAGLSGIVVLDIDVKNGKDGWDSLGFYDAPGTFNYFTPTGGSHYIYKAPDGVRLNGQGRYLGLDNVDRRGGASFILWHSDEVPTSRDEFTEAPEWLCEPAVLKSLDAFEGDIQNWYDQLVKGEPNSVVRHAMGTIPEDFSHEKMVSMQTHAIRVGAEGNPGVRELIEQIETAWLNRPEESHTTPKDQWAFKFAEALNSGIQKFGGLTETLKNLQDFNANQLPSSVNVSRFIGEPKDSANWHQAVEELVKYGFDKQYIVSAMWKAPATKDVSEEWGLSFVDRLVTEKIDENRPAATTEIIEPEKIPEPLKGGSKYPLLTDEERQEAIAQYRFEDMYLQLGRMGGFANETLFRAASWSVLSMAMMEGDKYIPASETDLLPLNLWITAIAWSGTGKTRTFKFEKAVLDNLIGAQDSLLGQEIYYRFSSNISPQGIHQNLLKRDKRPTLMLTDEASKFFIDIANERYMATVPDFLAEAYNGNITPIAKISAGELAGKTAWNPLQLHLTATPDRFFEQDLQEHFLSGFLARMNWVLTDRPVHKMNGKRMGQAVTLKEGVDDKVPPALRELIAFLVASQKAYPTSLPIYADQEALDRQELALNQMFNAIQGHPNQDVLDQSVTYLGYETMRKLAALTALYRGSKRVQLLDVQVALVQVQEWFDNLLLVAEKVDQTAFYKSCAEIELFVAGQRNGVATEAQIYRRFEKSVQRGKRDIDDRVDMLLATTRLVREPVTDGVVKYRANK